MKEFFSQDFFFLIFRRKKKKTMLIYVINFLFDALLLSLICYLDIIRTIR